MNHDCRGYFFERHGKRYYRCLLDSTFLDAATVGETCPNCDRPQCGIDVDTHPEPSWTPDDSPTVELEIDLPHYRSEVSRLTKERDEACEWVKPSIAPEQCPACNWCNTNAVMTPGRDGSNSRGGDRDNVSPATRWSTADVFAYLYANELPVHPARNSTNCRG